MAYCEVAAGVSLYYEDFGEGQAIVFTSAGAQNHKQWEGQVAGLAPRFRTITYDWRGTGLSDKPRGDYTGASAAEDICALVERIDLAPAVLVGHGIGAHPTLLTAEARPDLVKGVVLASGGPWFCGDHDGVHGGLSDAFMAYLQRTSGLASEKGIAYADTYAELARDWLYHQRPSDAVIASVLEQALSWPQFVLNEYVRSMRDINHRDRLEHITCPTLILQGRHDHKQRYEGALYMAKKIPNAQMITLENSAHMGQQEEVNAFNKAINDFASGL